jgi:hypothetical protein
MLTLKISNDEKEEKEMNKQIALNILNDKPVGFVFVLKCGSSINTSYRYFIKSDEDSAKEIFIDDYSVILSSSADDIEDIVSYEKIFDIIELEESKYEELRQLMVLTFSYTNRNDRKKVIENIRQLLK